MPCDKPLWFCATVSTLLVPRNHLDWFLGYPVRRTSFHPPASVFRVVAAHLTGMTITAPAIPEADLHEPRTATPGARLALASRAAQGFPATVDDPVVLARLQNLCAAPRPVPADEWRQPRSR